MLNSDLVFVAFLVTCGPSRPTTNFCSLQQSSATSPCLRAVVFFTGSCLAVSETGIVIVIFYQYLIRVLTGFTRTTAIISHFPLLESWCLFHWILFDSVWNGDYNFFHQYSIRVFTTLTSTILLSFRNLQNMRCFCFYSLFIIADLFFFLPVFCTASLSIGAFLLRVISVSRSYPLRNSVGWGWLSTGFPNWKWFEQTFVFLFTLNLLRLSSLVHVENCLGSLQDQKRTSGFPPKKLVWSFTIYLSGNRRSLLQPNTAQRSFFPITMLFL